MSSSTLSARLSHGRRFTPGSIDDSDRPGPGDLPRQASPPGGVVLRLRADALSRDEYHAAAEATLDPCACRGQFRHDAPARCPMPGRRVTTGHPVVRVAVRSGGDEPSARNERSATLLLVSRMRSATLSRIHAAAVGAADSASVRVSALSRAASRDEIAALLGLVVVGPPNVLNGFTNTPGQLRLTAPRG
jgi:hypothetical protein